MRQEGEKIRRVDIGAAGEPAGGRATALPIRQKLLHPGLSQPAIDINAA